jgi:glycosyltransferase involved in cell wall biosynthesis/ubiquinone/menaquinone biosynthesis C-methylase UbiE
MSAYLYVSGHLDSSGRLDTSALENTTERHKIGLQRPPLGPAGDLRGQLGDPAVTGLVMEMAKGWAGRAQLSLAAAALRFGKPVWLYWPAEQAVERLDRDRLRSYWRHWLTVQLARMTRRLFGRTSPQAVAPDLRERYDEAVGEAIRRVSPLPLEPIAPEAGEPLRGTGVYLRFDYWARITSGGSYGHTCYVAKELAAQTEGFVAFMASRYSLLDALGVRQVALEPPSESQSETDLLRAHAYYLRLLRPAFAALQPAYIYERICLGNFAGAVLSQEFSIPYIVEYNGSEISMKRSFEGSSYAFEEQYLAAEEAAFRQASLISVVSEPIRDALIARGIDPAKILVNPNGADPDVYAPAPPETREAIRRELGFAASDVVVGFTGTFGGWHGIDVLAAAMPTVCARNPSVRFLLIGDGNFKHLVDDAVRRHQLEPRVISVGRVPQEEGRRYLQACDIYLSPHSAHMVDSRFFGSPTKLFEYMALGGAVVASDLEQIGQVLSPALRARDLSSPDTETGDERAILCTPGEVGELVEAVARLAADPALRGRLGRNARQAVLDHYSWRRHVAHLWEFVRGEHRPVLAAPLDETHERLETGDAYKEQTQRQWDSDPAGSHYVKGAPPHTLEWFLEAERYRYGTYAPWMAETMEFAGHAGERILEIGGGMGTDLAQFARHGALVTDIDLSAGHLSLAQENFRLRGLEGRFIHQDAETLPFPDGEFDLVYSNGVIHHTPHTSRVVDEMFRVLKPGGRAIVMVYAENSLHYWRKLVGRLGLRERHLEQHSMGEIMSRHAELSTSRSRPLVKVYTRKRLRAMFHRFEQVRIVQRQLLPEELPRGFRWIPAGAAARLLGWNLIVKARKPGGA